MSTEFIWPSDLDRAENDELNRVCEYLEEVLDERDEYKKAAEHYVPVAHALAAHVERLAGTIEFLLDTGEWSNQETVSQIASGDISLAPTVSLARFKAKCQEEALEEGLRRMQGTCYGEVRVEEYIEELRSQAEGGE